METKGFSGRFNRIFGCTLVMTFYTNNIISTNFKTFGAADCKSKTIRGSAFLESRISWINFWCIGQNLTVFVTFLGINLKAFFFQRNSIKTRRNFYYNLASIRKVIFGICKIITFQKQRTSTCYLESRIICRVKNKFSYRSFKLVRINKLYYIFGCNCTSGIICKRTI